MAQFNPFFNEDTGWTPLDEMPDWQRQMMNSPGSGMTMPGVDPNLLNTINNYGQNVNSGGGGTNWMDPFAGMSNPGGGLYPGMPNSPSYTSPGGGTNTPPPTPPPTIASPSLLANNMGMTGAENVGGVGMYTGSNGPLDLNRFTPVQNTPPAGAPPGSIPTGDPNTWITPWGSTYTTPGSINNSNQAEYDAYRQRAFGNMMGPQGRGPQSNPYNELTQLLVQQPGSVNAQTFQGYMNSLQNPQQVQQTGPNPPQQAAPRPPQSGSNQLPFGNQRGTDPNGAYPQNSGRPAIIGSQGGMTPLRNNAGAMETAGNTMFNAAIGQGRGMAPSGGYGPSVPGGGFGPYSGPGTDPRITQQQQRDAYVNDPANAAYIAALTNRQGGPPEPGMQWFDGAGPYGTGAWTYPGGNENYQRGYPTGGLDPGPGTTQYNWFDYYSPESQARAREASNRQQAQISQLLQLGWPPEILSQMGGQQLSQLGNQPIPYSGQTLPDTSSGPGYQHTFSAQRQQQPTWQHQVAQFSSDPATQQAYLRDMFGGGGGPQVDPLPQIDYRAATFGGSLFPQGSGQTGGGERTPQTSSPNPINTTNPINSQGFNPWGNTQNRRSNFGNMSLFGNFGNQSGNGGGQTNPYGGSQYRGAGTYGRAASYGTSQRPSGF